MYLRRGHEEGALYHGKELTSDRHRHRNDDQMVSRPPMTVIPTVLMRPDYALPCADHGGDFHWIGIHHDCNNAVVRTLMALS